METTKIKAPAWFAILGILALLWNLIGVLAYFGHVLMTEEMKNALPPDQLEAMNAAPLWVIISFTIAVFGGIIAVILMVMRRKAALFFFQVSFAGIFFQQIHTFFFIDAVAIFGNIQGLVMPAILLFIGVVLILVNGHAVKQKWLR